MKINASEFNVGPVFLNSDFKNCFSFLLLIIEEKFLEDQKHDAFKSYNRIFLFKRNLYLVKSLFYSL